MPPAAWCGRPTSSWIRLLFNRRWRISSTRCQKKIANWRCRQKGTYGREGVRRFGIRFWAIMGIMSLIECIRWSRYGKAIAIVLNKVGVSLDSSKSKVIQTVDTWDQYLYVSKRGNFAYTLKISLPLKKSFF